MKNKQYTVVNNEEELANVLDHLHVLGKVWHSGKGALEFKPSMVFPYSISLNGTIGFQTAGLYESIGYEEVEFAKQTKRSERLKENLEEKDCLYIAGFDPSSSEDYSVGTSYAGGGSLNLNHILQSKVADDFLHATLLINQIEQQNRETEKLKKQVEDYRLEQQKQQEIEDGNKLIFDFLGHELNSPIIEVREDCVMSYTICNKIPNYYSDFSKLEQAVAKIIQSDEDLCLSTEAYEEGFHASFDGEEYSYGETIIEATWLAVVDRIKFEEKEKSEWAERVLVGERIVADMFGFILIGHSNTPPKCNC